MVQGVAPAGSSVWSPIAADSMTRRAVDHALPDGRDTLHSAEPPVGIYRERPSARQQFSDAHQRLSDVNALLKQVHDDTKQLLPDVYTNDIAAAPNDSGVPCIEATMVSVSLHDGQTFGAHAAHINEINFAPGAATPEHASVYRAGQSPAGAVASAARNAAVTPLSSACEKALVEGIDSGLGLYQFVSRKAHYQPEKSREAPIVSVIGKLWKASRQHQTELILGGRYRVTGFQQQPAAATDRVHYLLTVIDTKNGDETRVVPLTQTGLKFTGHILNVPEIETANTILDAHRALASAALNSVVRQAEPTIYSYAGIGRNATLITYRRIAKLITDGKITDKTSLADTLRATIRIERAACGKRFLHSDAQIHQLWKSLSHALAESVVAKNSGSASASQASVATSPIVEPRTLPRHGECTASSDTEGAALPATEPTTASANRPASAAASVAPNDDANGGGIARVGEPVAVEPTKLRPAAHTVAPRTATTTAAAPTTAAPTTAPITSRSTPVGDLTFDNLESADNAFHRNWKLAVKLLKARNPERGTRFENLFGVADRRTLIRHLSNRQLAALLAHLGVPQNDQGFVENDFLARNLTESERALIPALPKFTPEASEEALEKSRLQVAQDEASEEHKAAMNRAQYGVGAERAPRELPFIEESFLRWDNPGNGDCLFHSLHSTGPGNYLNDDYLKIIRERTARIRLHMADENKTEAGNNWHQMRISLGNTGLDAVFNENGIPLELSNAQFAEIQRRLHIFCSDLEIEQWLAIPGNPTKSIILVDGHPGFGKLVSFRMDEHDNVIREAISIDQLCDGQHLAPEDVRAKISEKINEAMNHHQSRRHLAIYFSQFHFQRIVGLRSLAECQRIWSAY